MKLMIFILGLAFLECKANDFKRDIIMPSYRMLSFNYDSKYLIYEPSISDEYPPPRNEKDFFLLLEKAASGDSNSNLLLFKLFLKDSNCKYFDFKPSIPNFICKKAVNYLIESVNINPDNNMALFEMSKLYHKGVVLNENENKANLILDEIIKKGGRDSVLVCDYLVEITLFDDDGNIKNIDKSRYYADIGAKNGSEKCKKYLNDIDNYMRN